MTILSIEIKKRNIILIKEFENTVCMTSLYCNQIEFIIAIIFDGGFSFVYKM